jgi:hypothetical protein
MTTPRSPAFTIANGLKNNNINKKIPPPTKIGALGGEKLKLVGRRFIA